MLYLLLTMFLCGEDQNIKNKIEENINVGEESEICGGRIIKTKVYNKGAFLSFMQNKPKLLGDASFILTALLVIYYIFTLCTKGKNVLKLGLSLLTAGAISNQYDRMKRGHVIDYFSFKCLKNVIFNLGDMFIFIGSLLIFVRELFKKD